MLAIFLVGLRWPAWAADIRTTPHNLAQNRKSVEADEVCVFCHTPQLPVGLDSKSSVAAKPAWQPSISLSHAFVMYDDIGRKQFEDKPAVGSQSIACLSCHDSSQAFSVTASVADHPFGIPYRGYSKSRRGSDAADRVDSESGEAPSRAAQHLKSYEDFRPPSKGKVDNRAVWWVSANGVSALRTRSDLPLYIRRGEGEEIPYVECSSCHDPHSANKLFLRVVNDTSKLCLTCHDK